MGYSLLLLILLIVIFFINNKFRRKTFGNITLINFFCIYLFLINIILFFDNSDVESTIISFSDNYIVYFIVFPILFEIFLIICILGKRKGREKNNNSLILINLLLIILGWSVIAIDNTYLNFLVVFSIIFYFSIILSMLINQIYLSKFYPNNKIDYLIILGCKIYDDGTPSSVLKTRLDKAIKYYEINKCKIIVSGCGRNKKISEAKGMMDYLIKNNVIKSDIILEDKSMDTRENIINSLRLIDVKKNKVALVTSDYHMYRSLQELSKYTSFVYGLCSKTNLIDYPNEFIRELLVEIYYNLVIYIIFLFLSIIILLSL